MDFEIKHSRFGNFLLGTTLFVPIFILDYAAMDSKDFNFLIFTLIATVFLGGFAFRHFKKGIQRKVVIAFNDEGIKSVEPAFEFTWKEIHGYKLSDSDKFLFIEFLFDKGKTSKRLNIAYCDKRRKEIDTYLSAKTKNCSNEEYST